MKNLIQTASLLILAGGVFCAHVASAEEFTCPLMQNQSNFLDLTDVANTNPNCEETNKNASCKEVISDPEAERRRIEAGLNHTMSPAFAEQNKGRVNQYLGVNKQFKPYFYQSEYDRQNNIEPKPLLNWFNDPAFASGGDIETLKKTFVDKYVKFEKDNDCKADFYGATNWVTNHPTIKTRDVSKLSDSEIKNKIAEVRAEMKKSERIAEVNKYLTDNNNKSVNGEDKDKNGFMLCNNNPQELKVQSYTAEEYPPCAKKFKHTFANNVFKINDQGKANELDKIMSHPDTVELAACIKDRMSRGATIHHISINSSATSLNNTGQAAKLFCAKGFEALSDARAKEAQDKILPKLFSNAGVTDFDAKSTTIYVNSKGSNGNGTSGPCVYTTDKNGVEVLKDEYKTEAGQAKLEQFKFVDVQVTFNESTKPIKSTNKFISVDYPCKKISFKCQPVKVEQVSN